MTTLDVLRDGVTAKRGVNPHTLEQVILLAVEIAREGREGRKIGSLFTVGDVEAVLEQSRNLILDPLYHHSDDVKHVDTFDMRETAKELAQLDGAFVVSDEGVFVSACRHLNASAAGVQMRLGLGSRHMAAASITLHTAAVAVVVSESSIVRIYDGGEIIAEIIPEQWLMKHYVSHMNESYTQRSGMGMTVMSKRA